MCSPQHTRAVLAESRCRQMRVSVRWPGISSDVKDFTESCLGCTAATPRNRLPPMIERHQEGPGNTAVQILRGRLEELEVVTSMF